MAQTEGPPAWRVAVTVPQRYADAFEEAFADGFTAVSAFEGEDGNWTVEAFAREKPDAGPLGIRVALIAGAVGIEEPALSLEKLPETDWLAASYKAFPPIRIGRFYIHGSHIDERVPPSSIGLTIDAATAFGTGEHPTTHGCLQAIERLSKRIRVKRALDMGCGTGILAFAIAKSCGCPVLAADIDRESVRVAGVNARVNRVADRVSALISDGYRHPMIGERGPYDLIVSNILARPLARMACDLAAHLAPGGTAVLAGLLAHQECQVLNAHRAQGLALVGRIPVKGWPTLILRKR